ncbi:hypothetical protein CO652_01710 [Rhizobium sp. H4]|nr:hypothetical protein CO652_01710 [Rhizobium sp. H4]
MIALRLRAGHSFLRHSPPPSSDPSGHLLHAGEKRVSRDLAIPLLPSRWGEGARRADEGATPQDARSSPSPCLHYLSLSICRSICSG